MKIARIITDYYQQFDADYSLDVPGEGYGGWKQAELEVDLEHTAVVIMHAWNCGTYETYPGWFRVAEWIPKAQRICAEVFPMLLKTVRDSDLKLFHVVSEGEYYKNYPGYKRAIELTGRDKSLKETIASDPVLDRLYDFKMKESFYGLHNKSDVEKGFKKLDFAQEARPIGDEGVAENAEQLFALCNEAGVNHLIYTGFAINWCLMFSPGGMVDMQRKGMMCSAIRQAVTAVENRETARNQLCKEIALWRVALGFGFVYELDNFMNGIISYHK
ncbi:hypothetical protein LLG38_10515 [bacterium]|nr:hypothetical protein [bacterium]